MRWLDVVDRFWQGRPAKGGGKCSYHSYTHYRDEVDVEDGKIVYYFHGYPIAKYYPATGVLVLDHCGYYTPTTRDRLSAIVPFGYISLIRDESMVLARWKSNVLYELPVVIDVNRRRVLDHNGELYLIPKLGRKKTERYDDYVVMKNSEGEIKYVLNKPISTRHIIVLKDGKILAPRLVWWNRSRYLKYYRQYVCIPVDPALVFN
ncbi:hypothetical protein DRO54_06200 [Candidatus Bathyarchaeota archaeon]|nr:MAG: hypothetical protein DRO54_06200 [Candidatus Bathyarchaeota archaeon]